MLLGLRTSGPVMSAPGRPAPDPAPGVSWPPVTGTVSVAVVTGTGPPTIPVPASWGPPLTVNALAGSVVPLTTVVPWLSVVAPRYDSTAPAASTRVPGPCLTRLADAAPEIAPASVRSAAAAPSAVLISRGDRPRLNLPASV